MKKSIKQLEIGVVLDHSSKALLRQVLSNTLEAIDGEFSPADVGIVAAHLRDITHHAETCVHGNEDSSQFTRGFIGDASNEALCDKLRTCPEWNVDWAFIMGEVKPLDFTKRIVG